MRDLPVKWLLSLSAKVVKAKERQQKGLIDKISATLILQNFLETR
jgi:RNase H-fold protein (predicted Holliday junction resolvase)